MATGSSKLAEALLPLDVEGCGPEGLGNPSSLTGVVVCDIDPAGDDIVASVFNRFGSNSTSGNDDDDDAGGMLLCVDSDSSMLVIVTVSAEEDIFYGPARQLAMYAIR